MAIADLLWACPACGGEAAIARGTRAACTVCGAAYRRGPGATIIQRLPGGRETALDAAEWLERLDARISPALSLKLAEHAFLFENLPNPLPILTQATAAPLPPQPLRLEDEHVGGHPTRSLAGASEGAKRAFYRDNFIDLMGRGLDPALHDVASLQAA